MVKTSTITYPREPIGSYQLYGLKYLIFELKTKCPLVEEFEGHVNPWQVAYHAAMLAALREVLATFPHTEERYRRATGADLLDRNALFISTVGSGKIVSHETAFGEGKFLFSVPEQQEPLHLEPSYFFRTGGPFLRRSGMDWNYILGVDLDNLCVLSDLNEEVRLYGTGRTTGGIEQLFLTGSAR